MLSHTGVIERWELLQAQDLSKEMRSKQNQQQWQQLNSDLSSVWTWLGETEEELEQQRRLDLCTDIQTIQQRIKKLKVSAGGSTHFPHALNISPCDSSETTCLTALLAGAAEGVRQAQADRPVRQPVQQRVREDGHGRVSPAAGQTEGHEQPLGRPGQLAGGVEGVPAGGAHAVSGRPKY